METNNEKFDAKAYLDNLQKKSEAAKENLQQDKERLKQKILDEWHQHSSVFFWEQCFRFVPYDVIKRTYKNVLNLETTGYPVKSHAGLFVSTLKKMGYFPFKKEDSDEPKTPNGEGAALCGSEPGGEASEEGPGGAA